MIIPLFILVLAPSQEKHLKINDWKMKCSFKGWPVVREYVSFRGCRGWNFMEIGHPQRETSIFNHSFLRRELLVLGSVGSLENIGKYMKVLGTLF